MGKIKWTVVPFYVIANLALILTGYYITAAIWCSYGLLATIASGFLFGILELIAADWSIITIKKP